MIRVCVPVLKRYDLLRKMLASLRYSTSKLDGVYIIDNGRDTRRLDMVLSGCTVKYSVHLPAKAMGVAESWNWFIENVAEERVIVNDDVEFMPLSLEKLTEPNADIVFAQGLGFSCFVLRDSCVRKIGVFDESISPGYAYYEDEDYMVRMRRGDVSAIDVRCGVTHLKSQTLAVFSEAETQEHHRRFHIARANFVEKWGMMPGDLREKDRVRLAEGLP